MQVEIFFTLFQFSCFYLFVSTNYSIFAARTNNNISMDIKVTINRKPEPEKPKGAMGMTGTFAIIFFAASLVCSKAYTGGCHSKYLLVLSVFFGFLAGIFLLAFFVFLAHKVGDDL